MIMNCEKAGCTAHGMAYTIFKVLSVRLCQEHEALMDTWNYEADPGSKFASLEADWQISLAALAGGMQPNPSPAEVWRECRMAGRQLAQMIRVWLKTPAEAPAAETP